MARTLTVISADNGTDAFQRVVDAINYQFKDRNLLGDRDGMDMSWDVCLADAVLSLGGDYAGIADAYYVALDGAALSQIVECDRHGGKWGTDLTCARCTESDGSPRLYHAPGPVGLGALA